MAINKYNQPSKDIHEFIYGYTFSIVHEIPLYEISTNSVNFSKAYTLGRITGCKEVQLLRLLNGNV